MTRITRSKSEKIILLKTGKRALRGEKTEHIDRTPVIIETSTDALFLKPIILVEDGIARNTKYYLRKTRKGMLRLE